MPNGGTDNCMNCSFNRANQPAERIKGMDPRSRIAFCSLRNIVIQSGSSYTYCKYSNYRQDHEERSSLFDDPHPNVPIKTIGAEVDGYGRVPYFKGIAPHTHGGIGNCTLCNEEFEEGIWITSYATDDEFNFGFCCNQHYETWATHVESEVKLTDLQDKLFNLIDEENFIDARGIAYLLRTRAEEFDKTPSNIKKRSYPLTFTNEQSWSPIHFALLKYDDGDELLSFIDLACDNDAPIIYNPFSWSPIHLSAYLGKSNAFNALIEIYKDYPKDLIKKDLFNRSPIEIAAKEGHLEIVQILLPFSYTSVEQKNEALLAATKNGNLFLAEALINSGADVNCRGDRDWTPLMNAAYHASDHTLTIYLLDQGADKTLKNLSGKTVMDELRPWSTNESSSLLELIEKHAKTT